MFTKEWLSAFIQLLVLIPSALSCYLPAKNRLKLSMLKLSALCCAVLIPFSAVCAFVLAANDLPTNVVLLPALLAFFFVFRATVKLDLPKTLAIYVGVCAVQTFPAQFGNLAEIYFPTSPDNINLISDFICLGLSCLVAVIFIYPARGIFYRMVDELEVPGVWYSVTALSAIFLIFNIIAAPGSYEAFRESRLLYLFPALELDMAALFGNIMENAISACAALPEEERYFNLTAELRHGNSLYVVSTNSFNGKVIKGKDGYRSTKHSGRGTGLISIAAVAEKYGGSAQFRNSDKEFYADVVMKI